MIRGAFACHSPCLKDKYDPEITCFSPSYFTKFFHKLKMTAYNHCRKTIHFVVSAVHSIVSYTTITHQGVLPYRCWCSTVMLLSEKLPRGCGPAICCPTPGPPPSPYPTCLTSCGPDSQLATLTPSSSHSTPPSFASPFPPPSLDIQNEEKEAACLVTGRDWSLD